MKSRINVVGAAIVKDGKILALRRAHGDDEIIHKFEFAGGKVEDGETPEEALIRECREELCLEIEVGEHLNTIEYDYPNTTVTLSVYFVKPLSGYVLNVHEEARWFDCDELDPAEWAPADKIFLGTIKKGYSKVVKAENSHDFAIIKSIADEVMHEVYDDGARLDEQVDYIVNNYLTEEAIAKDIAEKKYTYNLIYFNGEECGFYSYCPAKYYSEQYTEGTYLSRLYMRKFARGKSITSKLLATLPRPVYLTVKRDNMNSVNIYKRCGFKIKQSVSKDIGGGFVTDDFLMVLEK